MDKRISIWLFSMLLLCCSGCGVIVRGVVDGAVSFKNSQLFHQGRHGALTEQEKNWARVAWNYFKNNLNPQTGFANAVDNYPSTTMWHVADCLAALVAAHELELVGREEFDQRLSVLLHTLNTMPLFEGKLPNKAYNAQTGAMVNYENKPEEIGWSASDLGRLLVWLKIVKCKYPVYGEYVDKVVLRWNFCDVVDASGGLQSGIKTGEGIRHHEDHRLGYEQYAAKGFSLWGFDTFRASRVRQQETIRINGIDFPYDNRRPEEGGDLSPILSQGFLLDGMEFNWGKTDDTSSLTGRHTDPGTEQLAEAIYKVQEARYEQEHIITARTDHQLPEPPYFVYDSIFAAGYPWNVISDSGMYYKDATLVATKAAFGMWVLWKTPYTDRLIDSVSSLYDGERGWYEGRREKTGGYLYLITCGTNSAVLESLLYKVQGKCVECAKGADYYDLYLRDSFKVQGHCFPPERGYR